MTEVGLNQDNNLKIWKLKLMVRVVSTKTPNDLWVYYTANIFNSTKSRRYMWKVEKLVTQPTIRASLKTAQLMKEAHGILK